MTKRKRARKKRYQNRTNDHRITNIMFKVKVNKKILRVPTISVQAMEVGSINHHNNNNNNNIAFPS